MGIRPCSPARRGGCSDDDDPVPASLTLSAETVVFPIDGGSKTVAVVSSTAEAVLTAESDNEWCRASIAGGTLTITAETNAAPEIRKAVVTVKSTDGAPDGKIAVSQEAAAETTLAISAAGDFEFDSEGGTCTVTVKSNRTWTASTEAGWLTLESDPATGTLVIEARPNTGEQVLESTVRIEAGSGVYAKSQTVAVRQQTRAANAYLNIIGQYEIYADAWLYTKRSGSYITFSALEGGIFPAGDPNCEIIAGEYNTSFILKNFMMSGMTYQIMYDKQTNTIEWPLGWYIGYYSSYAYYLCYASITVSETSSSFNSPEAKSVTCSISDDFRTISVNGLSDDGTDGMGIYYMYDEYGMYPTVNAYYPFGPKIELRKKTDAASDEDAGAAAASTTGMKLVRTQAPHRIPDHVETAVPVRLN